MMYLYLLLAYIKFVKTRYLNVSTSPRSRDRADHSARMRDSLSESTFRHNAEHREVSASQTKAPTMSAVGDTFMFAIIERCA